MRLRLLKAWAQEPLTLDEVMRETAERHGVTADEVLAKTKERRVVRIRQEFTWEAVDRYGFRVRAVAAFLDTEHSVVGHSRRRHEERRAQT